MKLYICSNTPNMNDNIEGRYCLITEEGECVGNWISSNKYFAKNDLYTQNPKAIEELTERFGECECLFLGEDDMTAERLRVLNKTFHIRSKSNLEIHFYERLSDIPADVTCYLCWNKTKEAIEQKVERIVTIQMGLLSTRLIENGYRIFVHPVDGGQYEIKLGKNNCTDIEIHLSYNLFKMWDANAFHIPKED